MCGSRQGTGSQDPKLERAGVGTQTKGWGRGTVRSLDDSCFSGPQSWSEVVVQKKREDGRTPATPRSVETRCSLISPSCCAHSSLTSCPCHLRAPLSPP